MSNNTLENNEFNILDGSIYDEKSKFLVDIFSIEDLYNIKMENVNFDLVISQRPYVWKYNQIDELLKDVDKNESIYDLSEIKLEYVTHEGEKIFFKIIDGQQRLTSLFLLYSFAIRNKSLYDKDKTRELFQAIDNYDIKKLPFFKLKNNAQIDNVVKSLYSSIFINLDEHSEKEWVDIEDSDYKDLHEFINQITDDDEVKKTFLNDITYKNMINNYFEMHNKRKDKDFQDLLKKFFSKTESVFLSFKVTYNQTLVDKIYNFENTNTRGIRLSFFDEYKSYLLSLFVEKQFKNENINNSLTQISSYFDKISSIIVKNFPDADEIEKKAIILIETFYKLIQLNEKIAYDAKGEIVKARIDPITTLNKAKNNTKIEKEIKNHFEKFEFSTKTRNPKLFALLINLVKRMVEFEEETSKTDFKNVELIPYILYKSDNIKRDKLERSMRNWRFYYFGQHFEKYEENEKNLAHDPWNNCYIHDYFRWKEKNDIIISLNEKISNSVTSREEKINIDNINNIGMYMFNNIQYTDNEKDAFFKLFLPYHTKNTVLNGQIHHIVPQKFYTEKSKIFEHCIKVIEDEVKNQHSTNIHMRKEKIYEYIKNIKEKSNSIPCLALRGKKVSIKKHEEAVHEIKKFWNDNHMFFDCSVRIPINEKMERECKEIFDLLMEDLTSLEAVYNDDSKKLDFNAILTHYRNISKNINDYCDTKTQIFKDLIKYEK